VKVCNSFNFAIDCTTFNLFYLRLNIYFLVPSLFNTFAMKVNNGFRKDNNLIKFEIFVPALLKLYLKRSEFTLY